MTQPKTPNSRRNLDLAIDRLCVKTGDEPGRVKRPLATAIVGQMLPDGAAKGGNALKIRFGKDVTRFSRDLDTARASSLGEYVSRLEGSLAQGWCGFTGTIVPKEPPSPKGVPAAYIMQPFKVKLAYNGKSWMTLPLEVGHNEIGDADDPDMVSSPEAAAILAELEFPEPGPVPCMRLEHQIAQKLHAASGAGSERAHNLIDLQIAVAGGRIDYAKVREVCVKLFDYRREQAWPPTIVKGNGWDELYASQSKGLNVLPTADDAIEWSNDLVAKINASEQRTRRRGLPYTEPRQHRPAVWRCRPAVEPVSGTRP